MNQAYFIQKFSTHSDEEILKIINSPEDYQATAVNTAIQIAIERKILSDEMVQSLQNQSIVQWHYECNGAQLGPISETELIELFKLEKIDQSTVIWRKGLENWIELHKSELARIIPSDIPPPLIGSKVSNTFVWILAFAPIVGFFAQTIIAGLILQSKGASATDYNWNALVKAQVSNLWWISLALNILLCVLDEIKLKSAGHNTSKFSGFWLFLVPVYLFKRASHLNQTPSYAWIWIVAFVISLFLN